MDASSFVAEVEKTLGLSLRELRSIGATPFRFGALASNKKTREALTQVSDRCLDWAADGTAFVGLMNDEAAYGVYAGPRISPLEIFTTFEVGSHNDWDVQQEQALAVMTEIFQVAPYVAYFADQAGFQVRFLNAVSEAQAKQFQDQITEVCFDAITLSLDQYGIELSEFIRKYGRLVLWWD